MAIEKILVVDDEMIIRNFLTETLRRKQFDVTGAENGTAALKKLKEGTFDLVITDMKMPDMTGIEVLKAVKATSPETLVIVITAYGSIENAVEAMHLGAYNYLIKPFSPDTIEAVIEKACEHQRLLQENSYLREQANQGGARRAHNVIGKSPAMQRILEEVRRVAKSNASVFISGESGTGKEVIAHAVHHYSLRQERPFIRVNCAAVPESLIESEFFGHEKGAFTGANNRRCGRFELADSGTLLLDEITEIPLALQAKLLRVIQEQEFERVGGSKSIKVDVRLISTSNRIMEEAINEKIFREDLYYRLNVIPIHIPPLRERPEDILPLCEYYLEQMCIENHKPKKRLTPSACKRLQEYHWPGNVRELANILERVVVMDYASKVEAAHINLTEHSTHIPEVEKLSEDDSMLEVPVGTSLHELEKKMIIETLQAQAMNRTRTAQILGISIRTLRNKLNEYSKN